MISMAGLDFRIVIFVEDVARRTVKVLITPA
jgi:hypothetical protein